ncbi:MAG: GNAT family N-acetyltransferase [Pseudonocardiaceae bacterium]|nr:GNAT family N-acetyltransferase [Pseudonocardiaceae bacterium]
MTIRTLSPGEIDEFFRVVEGAFLTDLRSDVLDLYRALIEPQRAHALLDGDTLVGGGAILSRDMTLPGAGPVPVAAVTAVGVAPDQRRRGALSTLMRTQLDGLHESGAEPVAALWASEGGIYGRFGYGTAARRARLAAPSGTAFRPGVDTSGSPVRLLDREQARPVMQRLHARIAPQRVGWISRPDAAWDEWLHDAEHSRRGASALRYLVAGEHGYAIFRAKEGGDERGPRFEIRVHELAAETPAAHAALWRFLLDVDLGAEVVHRNLAVDDPLPLLLADPRAAVQTVSDSLWIRLVDLDRALRARRYTAPCDLVLEVADALCPWNAGSWRLQVDSDGAARVQRSDAEPDLRCDIADLAAAYLGDTRFTALAAAARVVELRPGAVPAASRAFAGDTAPHCPEVF